jgi:hypothetical protein
LPNQLIHEVCLSYQDISCEVIMKKQTLATIAFLLVLVLAFALPAQQTSAASATVVLKPSSITTLSGGTGGQPVSALWIQDQSGTQDNSTKYVTFTTPSVIYNGYRTFLLPVSVTPASVTSFRVTAHYKGPLKSSQLWSWYLYNWALKAYVKIGDNSSVSSSASWTSLTFNAASAARFVNATRNIRLLLKSSNNTGNAKLDFEAITVTYTASIPPTIACSLFPSDNVWNTPINTLPVNSHSAAWVNSIGLSTGLHMDFGSGTWAGGPIGIPYNVSNSTTPKYTVGFYYPDESDAGPYPIPNNAAIEYGSDHHLLVVDNSTCTLYEIYDLSHNSNGSWSGGSGAIWHLSSDALRPAGWTSADAAGLPILPGLVRYSEIQAGAINHAIRFTANSTNSYIWPARHLTSGSPGVITSTPPMGARFRLKASFVISGYPAQMQVLLQAMKTYGIILADNGSDWYISGAPDSRWNNDTLHLLNNITGSDFEAVDESSLIVNPNSGATK